MKVLYLSHGECLTGGYFLEKNLCTALGSYEEKRFRKNYRGVLAWFELFFRSFIAAKADVVVTVARLAWPVYLRNMFNNSKIILVLHNYDRNDEKPVLYYKLLGGFLKLLARKKKKMALVVVAEYWRDHFEKHWDIESNIFIFPNTFDVAGFRRYIKPVSSKERLVHFGQYSAKADLVLYRSLFSELQLLGYECYFSTPIPVVSDLPVIYFDTHGAYLEKMSEAVCTVIMNRIHEGWNRVAHESFLVGTQVISNGMGGLMELLSAGNGYRETHVNEICQLVEKNEWRSIDFESLQRFDSANDRSFAEPIRTWMELK